MDRRSAFLRRMAATAALVSLVAMGAYVSAAAREVVPGLELSQTAISERLARVESSETLGPDARARVVRFYQEALEDLVVAGRQSRKAESFEIARAAAPETLAELRREMTRPATPLAVPADATTAELEALHSGAITELASARGILAKVEGEQNKRSRRRIEIPQAIAAASEQLDDVESRLERMPVPASPDETAIAQRASAMARRDALQAEIDVYRNEMLSYEARRELLAARRDELVRRIARLTEQVDELRVAVGRKRRDEAARDVRTASEAQRDLAGLHPELGRIAERNAELASLRTGSNGLAERIQRVKADIVAIDNQRDSIAKRFDGLRQKAAAVGFTPAIGLMLRKERTELPNISGIQRSMRQRQSTISDTQLALIELEESRRSLADVDTAVGDVLAAMYDLRDPADRERARREARELLLTQRTYFDSVIDDYDTYFTGLIELDAKERELVDAVATYADFIGEHVLWIRGSSVLEGHPVRSAVDAGRWLAQPENLVSLVEGATMTLTIRPLTTTAAAFAWLLLFLYRRRLRRALEELCPSRAKALGYSAGKTLNAIGLATLAAAVWPSLLWLTAWLIDGVEGASGEYGRAVAFGLNATANLYFVAQLYRQMALPGGLGEVHFGWSPKLMQAVRRHLATTMAFGLPALFVAATLDHQSIDAWNGSLGRFAFIVAMAAVAIAVYRLLRPSTGVLDNLSRRAGAPAVKRGVGALHWVATAIPVALVLASAVGYDFAARNLALKLGFTLVIVFGVVVANAFVVRWLLLARRRLALRQASERRAAQQQAEERQQSDGEAPLVTEAATVDLSMVNAQMRRLLQWAVAAALILGVWLTWSDVLPAFRVFERVELWSVPQDVVQTVDVDGRTEERTVTEKVPITLGNVFAAAVVILLAVAAGRNIPGFLEITILQQLPFDAGLRYAVTAVSRYVIGVVGIVVAVNSLGVRWSQVQWLVAAMTVGLGFGLQEIFANFVSGLIILFERPIRVGDVVTLGAVSGTVTKIRIRATTIIDWDRKELIVPNKEFITGQLINWTLSDQTLRVVVPVGIAYGSDTKLAERLLIKVAGECEYVLPDPPPTVLFNDFGESSLEFHLRAFISTIDHYWRSRHALRMAIDEEFRKAGIEIAFPQRDLHLRSTGAPIPVTVRYESEPAQPEAAPESALPSVDGGK